jgi:hypothetical protein
MAKWPNDQIEGVKVHKVIPRPTALRAVGKNLCILYKVSIALGYTPKRWTDSKVIFNYIPAKRSY